MATEYQSHDGDRVLTWGQLYTLYDDLPANHPAATLLIAIAQGNMALAQHELAAMRAR